MKRYTLFFLLLASSLVYCMENSDDYRAFDDANFSDGESLYVETLKSRLGRQLLLNARAAERRALNSAYIEHRMGLQRIKPSEAFGRKCSVDPNGKSNAQTALALRNADVLQQQKSKIAELAEAIADTEYYLIDQAIDSNSFRRKRYEVSRRDDIILLKKMIEEDPADGHSLEDILKRVEQTHRQWPPAGPEFSKLSAHTILYEAIVAKNEKKNQKEKEVLDQLNVLE